MKIRITFILFLLFLLSAVTVQISFPQSQRELLELSYKNNDYNLLDTFFARWQKENNAISKEKFENLPDIEKDIYNIYYTCYRPLDLKSIKWNYEEYSNKGCRYLVLQNSIDFEVVKTMNRDSLYSKCVAIVKDLGDTANLSYLDKQKDRITWNDPFLSMFLFSAKEHISKNKIDDFYPYESYNGLRTVYETEFYKIILTSFLWKDKISDYKVSGTTKIKYSEAELRDINSEYEKRRHFLNQVVRTAERKVGVSLQSVGSLKHFSKYPYVQEIFVDEAGLYALVIMSFDGDEEVLLPMKKNNGKWEIDN